MPKKPSVAGAQKRTAERAIKKRLRLAARLYDLEPHWLFAIARVESNMNPDARNLDSGAAGIFQYLKGTAKEENIDPMNLPEAAAATAKRIARDVAAMSKVGHTATLTDVYLSHQQGRSGYAEILRCFEAGIEQGRLSDSRIRNMSGNLPPAERIAFSGMTSHWSKADGFLRFWQGRMARALEEVTP
jgi:hypothetical protein